MGIERSLSLLLAVVLSCGEAPVTKAPTAVNVSSEPSGASPGTSPAPSAAPAVSLAAPVSEGSPWNESLPPGVQRLTDEEKKELSSRCSAFVKAITAKLPAKAKTRFAAAEALLAMLAANEERCASLLRRDLTEYRASTLESQAVVRLKMILSGLGDALEKNGRLCASAGPTPRDVQSVKTAPYRADRAESSAWACVGGVAEGPEWYQYELRTDATAKTYRIVARGFSVQEHPTELFIAGTVTEGKIDRSANILRR